MNELQNRMPPDNPLPDDRVDELAKEYDESNADPENSRKLDELHFQISGLLGKNNLNLLREYTDWLIARYNTDSAWFYHKGLEDAGRFSLRPDEAELLIT